MAIITKQWCAWDNDKGKVSFQYDNTVTAGFPFGKLTAFSWANSSTQGQLVSMTLEPGITSAAVSGTVTSIPISAGTKTPVPNGATVTVGGVSFVANGNTAVSATSIPVQSQVIGTSIPSGSQIEVPLPAATIPPVGQQVTEPPFYGSVVEGSTGSVDVSALGVPMIDTISHGLHFTWVPATLNCAGM